jgi:hypothetical protein
MAKLHTMQSMEMTDDEKLDAPTPIAMPEKPEFPYGLRISLTEAEFKKLKLEGSDAEVGGIFHGHFLARVTSVSKTDGPDGPCCRVEAQIEDLSIESEDVENGEK